MATDEPSMEEALSKASNLCNEMKESTTLCSRLVERLEFVKVELETRSSSTAEEQVQLKKQLVDAIGLVVSFFSKYSELPPLQRISASRVIREEVPVLHAIIDKVFHIAGLNRTPEMAAWRKQHRESDIDAQRIQFEALVEEDQDAFSRDLSSSDVEEALMEIKHEIDSGKNRSKFTALLENVLNVVIHTVDGATIPVVPRYFVRRDDVKLGELIDMGSFGEVYVAKWGPGETEVIAKLLYLDGPDTKKQFVRESEIWSKLNHPYVNKMLGGCPVGKPLFFIAEYAERGNLSDYLKKSENTSQLWRLFHQAAQGLSYLHSRNIIHCDIKCNNILVGKDGNARLCDFGFSHIRKLSIGMSVKEQPSSTRWKAPECLLESGAAANPTFESDVYSLAMSIIEAKIGSVPWGVMGDDDIIDEVGDENGYPRPEGDVFTDDEWNLVQGMTAFDPEERLSLREVIRRLDELAKEEP